MLALECALIRHCAPAQHHGLDAQVGSRLGKLGASVMTTTKGLFEQVQESIQQELDSVEDYLNKSAEKPATSRSASRSSSARCDAFEGSQDPGTGLSASIDGLVHSVGSCKRISCGL